MELPDLEAWLGVKAVFVKAGIAGSIVGAVVQRVADWREAMARGVAGVGCAAYISPLIATKAGITDIESIGALAFCIGLSGMGLATWIIAQMKDPWRVIRAWRGSDSADDKPGDRP